MTRRAFIGWIRYAACFTLAISTGSGVTLLVATEAWAWALLAFGAGSLLCASLAPDLEFWRVQPPDPSREDWPDMPFDYTCSCGLFVHHMHRAIHSDDCPYRDVAAWKRA